MIIYEKSSLFATLIEHIALLKSHTIVFCLTIYEKLVIQQHLKFANLDSKVDIIAFEDIHTDPKIGVLFGVKCEDCSTILDGIALKDVMLKHNIKPSDIPDVLALLEKGFADESIYNNTLAFDKKSELIAALNAYPSEYKIKAKIMKQLSNVNGQLQYDVIFCYNKNTVPLFLSFIKKWMHSHGALLYIQDKKSRPLYNLLKEDMPALSLDKKSFHGSFKFQNLQMATCNIELSIAIIKAMHGLKYTICTDDKKFRKTFANIARQYNIFVSKATLFKDTKAFMLLQKCYRAILNPNNLTVYSLLFELLDEELLMQVDAILRDNYGSFNYYDITLRCDSLSAVIKDMMHMHPLDFFLIYFAEYELPVEVRCILSKYDHIVDEDLIHVVGDLIVEQTSNQDQELRFISISNLLLCPEENIVVVNFNEYIASQYYKTIATFYSLCNKSLGNNISFWTLYSESLIPIYKSLFEVIHIHHSIDDFKLDYKPRRPSITVVNSRIPKKLSATAIETYMQNPYIFYIQYVLGIEPLTPMQIGLTSLVEYKLFGVLLHQVIAEEPKNELEFCARFEKLLPWQLRHDLQKIWGARVAKIAEWYCNYFKHIPCKHEIYLKDTINEFVINARADLICSIDGVDAIVDFKTTTLPSSADVLTGIKPQLAIEKLLYNKEARAFYIQLIGKKDVARLFEIKINVEEAEKGLLNVLELLSSSGVKFMSTAKQRLGYEHILRKEEWFG